MLIFNIVSNFQVYLQMYQNTSMKRKSRRRWRTLLFVSHQKNLEEDLLGAPRLVNGHLQRWALTQTSPLAARESESLAR